MQVTQIIKKKLPSYLKIKIKKLIGAKNYFKLKSFFALDDFGEVNIIHQFFASKSLAKPGVMVDVGAHIGGSLIDFAFNGWRVFAFEPDDNNRKTLEDLFGNIKSVSIDKRAVSDKNQKGIQFYNSDVSTGISGLSCFHPSHRESQLVETITLKHFINDNNILKIDFLKIDTEGFDLMVLKGVPWDTIIPSVILCEFEDRKTIPLGYSFHDLANYLVDNGYSLMVSEWYPIVEYGSIHKWRRFTEYPCELLDKNAMGNIIALKDKVLFNDFTSFIKEYEEGRENIKEM